MAPEITIDDRTNVVFKLSDGLTIEVCIRSGILRITSQGQMKVKPVAGNRVDLSHDNGMFDIKVTGLAGVATKEVPVLAKKGEKCQDLDSSC